MPLTEGLTSTVKSLTDSISKSLSISIAADSPYSLIVAQTIATVTMILLILWVFCFGTTSADAFLLAIPKRRRPNFIRNPLRRNSPVGKNQRIRDGSNSVVSGRGASLSNSIFFWRRWRRQRVGVVNDDDKYTRGGAFWGSGNDDDDLSFIFEDDLDLWDDGVPFVVDPNNGARSVQSSDSSDSLLDPADMTPDVTHFCFLIHGHRGLSKDLRYMQAVMRRAGAVERRRRWQRAFEIKTEKAETTSPGESHSSVSSPAAAAPSPPSSLKDPGSQSNESLRHDIVVHNAVCNEHKTTDGVRNGGERLVEEMIQVICEEMEKRPLPSSDRGALQDVTVSVVGNSLGGLFGRYAIAKLVEQCTTIDDPAHGGKCWILKDKYRIHFNIFCTTATPHLGISGHTYVQLPRAAEIGVAHALGDTGKDLFRLNDLIHDMSTSPSFLRPLASFRKRIAYANAYATDFPVPASTAAFLSESSTYPHHFVGESSSPRQRQEGKCSQEDLSSNGDDEETVEVVDDNGLIIATLHTPASHHLHKDYGQHGDESKSSSDEDDEEGDELHRMSKSLDRLGWKKVFVDMRYDVPSVELPQALHVRRRHPTLATFTSTDHDCYLKSLREHKSVVQSKDIASAVALPPTFDRLSIPLGHNMMVAFSRSATSSSFNKAGRPVVDALAKELVQDIFSWDVTESKD